jgi:hypothetical protein
MTDRVSLGHWLRRFLLEYAASDRNLSPNGNREVARIAVVTRRALLLRIDAWRRAASYVDRILRGAKAAAVPIAWPARREFPR